MQAQNKSITVCYFAKLREERGLSQEALLTASSSPRELFAELNTQHHFTLAPTALKVAVNDEFSSWDRDLRSGDSVIFIPPVAGG